jgi:hypothetical protein
MLKAERIPPGKEDDLKELLTLLKFVVYLQTYYFQYRNNKNLN